MVIRAGISSGYRRKLAIMGAFLLAFGLWAGYDALVKYPVEQERYQAWQQYQDQGNPAGWQEHAQKNDWPADEPKRRTNGHFYFNYALMTLIPLGGWLLYGAATAGKRWIEADEQGICTHRGQQFNYDQITAIDEKRWKAKGIAKIHYKAATGRPGVLVLDDYNYDMQPTRDIHARAKRALDPSWSPEGASQDAPLPDLADASDGSSHQPPTQS